MKQIFGIINLKFKTKTYLCFNPTQPPVWIFYCWDNKPRSLSYNHEGTKTLECVEKHLEYRDDEEFKEFEKVKKGMKSRKKIIGDGII